MSWCKKNCYIFYPIRTFEAAKCLDPFSSINKFHTLITGLTKKLTDSIVVLHLSDSSSCVIWRSVIVCTKKKSKTERSISPSTIRRTRFFIGNFSSEAFSLLLEFVQPVSLSVQSPRSMRRCFQCTSTMSAYFLVFGKFFTNILIVLSQVKRNSIQLMFHSKQTYSAPNSVMSSFVIVRDFIKCSDPKENCLSAENRLFQLSFL